MSLWGNKDELASAPAWLAQTTFVDLTAAASIDAGTDAIKRAEHGLKTGDKIKYSKGAGGVDPANISDGTSYFVGTIDSDQFKLYDTKANALANGDVGRVDITGVAGSGATLHSFQVVPSDIFFVDSVEAAVTANRAKGFQTPGWYRFNSKAIYDGTLVALANVEITSTAGAVSFDSNTDIAVGDKVVLSAAASGNEGTLAAGTYLVGVTNGSTTATLTTLEGASIITVVATANAKIGSVNAGTTVKVDHATFRSQAELLIAMGDATGTVTGATDGIDGQDDSTVSSGATLITISGALADVSYDHGGSGNGNANFAITVACTDSGVVACQLQESTDGGTTFANIGSAVNSSAGGSAVTLPVAIADTSKNGFKYRAVLTSALADTVTSAVKTLTVT